MNTHLKTAVKRFWTLGRKQVALPERATGRANASLGYGIWAFFG